LQARQALTGAALFMPAGALLAALATTSTTFTTRQAIDGDCSKDELG
jgi:hypothetical protein